MSSLLLTNEECRVIVARETNGGGEFVSYKTQLISETETLGFLGNHFLLKICFKLNNNVNNEFNCFLKTIPLENENFKEYVLNLRVFYKEGVLYEQLMNNLQKFDDQKQFAARCIYVKQENFIILENLYTKGYRTCREDLNIGHGRAFMEAVARLHASGVVYEEKQAKNNYRLFDEFEEMFEENTFIGNKKHLRYKMIENTMKSIVDAMQLLGDESIDARIPQKLLKFIENDIFSYTKPSTTYRNVLSHADLWKNNMMFRSRAAKGGGGGKTNDEEFDCVLVDFQFVRYAPSAFDLLTALHVNYTSNFLQTHRNDLLRFYYETFSDFLARNQVVCDAVLNANDFRASLVDFELPSLVAATMFATIIFLSDELSNEMVRDEETFYDYTYINRSKYVRKEWMGNARFRERFGDVLKRLVDCLKRYI